MARSDCGENVTDLAVIDIINLHFPCLNHSIIGVFQTCELRLRYNLLIDFTQH